MSKTVLVVFQKHPKVFFVKSIAYISATKCCSEAVSYSKQTAGYPLITSYNEANYKNYDNLKNGDDPKNKDDPKSEEDLKKQRQPRKTKATSENKEDLKSEDNLQKEDKTFLNERKLQGVSKDLDSISARGAETIFSSSRERSACILQT